MVSYTAAESLQPYELIMLQNAQPGVAHELRRVFQDACRDLCEHGVPRERLEASSAATNTTCASATTVSPTAWPLRATR